MLDHCPSGRADPCSSAATDICVLRCDIIRVPPWQFVKHLSRCVPSRIPHAFFLGGERFSSALCECSFFRHSPGTKNQILPSPSSFLLCVFPYQKSQQEEALPCKCSTSVIFSNCKLRTMPRTLPSRRTVLGISEQRESTAKRPSFTRIGLAL